MGGPDNQQNAPEVRDERREGEEDAKEDLELTAEDAEDVTGGAESDLWKWRK